MGEKIALKFHKLRMWTTLSWALLLVLGLMSRGVISNLHFWMLFIAITILFAIDIVYFVIRVSEAHYLQVTQQRVVIKRVFQPPQTMTISEIKSIRVFERDASVERIVLLNGSQEIEIKQEYTLSKEIILAIIQESPDYPEALELERVNV